MKKYDIIPIIFWIGLSLFVMVLSNKLGLGKLHHPGPGFMPFYIGVLLLIISLYLLLRYILKKGDRGETAKKDQSQIDLWKIAIVVASLIAYSLFLERLGFLIATFILVTLLFKTAGMRRWSFTFMSSVLTVLVTYFLFTYLGLNFPKGILHWR